MVSAQVDLGWVELVLGRLAASRIVFGVEADTASMPGWMYRSRLRWPRWAGLLTTTEPHRRLAQVGQSRVTQ